MTQKHLVTSHDLTGAECFSIGNLEESSILGFLFISPLLIVKLLT
jgi:hypothetical protein